MFDNQFKPKRLRPATFWSFLFLFLVLYLEAAFVSHRWGLATFYSFMAVGLSYLHFVVTKGRWR